MQQPAMIDNGNAPGDGLLKAFLCDRDVACPQCDYNLRNLHGSRCPECGEELVLGVNLVEPRQKLLIAGLIGLAAGVGFNGLLMIYLGIQMLERHWGGGYDTFLLVNGVGVAVEGAALGVWLYQWRRIRRAPRGVRTSLMLACWGLTLANFVIFSLTI